MPNISDAVFDALGNPTRREILKIVADHSTTVGTIAGEFDVSRPAISKHIRILQEAELVSLEQRGRERVVSLRRDGFTEAKRYLDGFWKDVLSAFADHVES